jgi:hypothetical protein
MEIERRPKARWPRQPGHRSSHARIAQAGRAVGSDRESKLDRRTHLTAPRHFRCAGLNVAEGSEDGAVAARSDEIAALHRHVGPSGSRSAKASRPRMRITR